MKPTTSSALTKRACGLPRPSPPTDRAALRARDWRARKIDDPSVLVPKSQGGPRLDIPRLDGADQSIRDAAEPTNLAGRHAGERVPQATLRHLRRVGPYDRVPRRAFHALDAAIGPIRAHGTNPRRSGRARRGGTLL